MLQKSQFESQKLIEQKQHINLDIEPKSSQQVIDSKIETPQIECIPNLESLEDNLERGDTIQIEDGVTDTHPKERILPPNIDD